MPRVSRYACGLEGSRPYIWISSISWNAEQTRATTGPAPFQRRVGEDGSLVAVSRGFDIVRAKRLSSRDQCNAARRPAPVSRSSQCNCSFLGTLLFAEQQGRDLTIFHSVGMIRSHHGLFCAGPSRLVPGARMSRPDGADRIGILGATAR